MSDKKIKNKNIVIAFGNDKIIYRWPTFAEYLRNYFSDDEDFTIPIALKFISEQPLATPVPIKKYLKSINENIKTTNNIKLKQRLNKYGHFTYKSYLEYLHPKNGNNLIYVSKQNKITMNKLGRPKDVINVSEVKEDQKINYLIQHLLKFDKNDINQLIYNLLQKDDKVITKSEYRKLFMAYSLI